MFFSNIFPCFFVRTKNEIEIVVAVAAANV